MAQGLSVFYEWRNKRVELLYLILIKMNGLSGRRFHSMTFCVSPPCMIVRMLTGTEVLTWTVIADKGCLIKLFAMRNLIIRTPCHSTVTFVSAPTVFCTGWGFRRYECSVFLYLTGNCRRLITELICNLPEAVTVCDVLLYHTSAC